jgi:N-acetylmuramoyl-L-alanine amidase
MKIVSHWLEDDQHPVEKDPSDNYGKGAQKNFNITQRYLVIHYTAGGSAEGSRSWFKNPASEASAHFVIGRDGKTWQIVPLNRRAWHAGVSAYGNLTDLNSYSIGIELGNEGKLNKYADGNWYFVVETKAGPKKARIDPSEVIIAPHRNDPSKTEAGWKEFPKIQLDACATVAHALHSHYQFEDIIGHDDISWPRKADPGPAFPMDRFRSRILGRR